MLFVKSVDSTDQLLTTFCKIETIINI